MNTQLEQIESRLAEIETEAAALREKLLSESPNILSPKEAARLIRCPLPTIYFHIKSGRIKSSRFFGRIKIKKDDLLSVIKASEIAA
jgi:excisionase family DNA binding protein